MNPFTSRRDFVKAGSSLTAGALLAAPHVARAAKNDKVIKIGLVGIGGRGSGAAAQAMGADENVRPDCYWRLVRGSHQATQPHSQGPRPKQISSYPRNDLFRV